MLKSLLPFAVPFGVALAATAAIRLIGAPGEKEPGRGARWAGLGVALGFLAGWIALLDQPWVPLDALSRVLHVGVGGVLLGIVLDLTQSRRLVGHVLIAIYAVGCAGASAMGGLTFKSIGFDHIVVGAVLAVLWFAVIAKLRALAQHPPTGLTVAVAAAVGLGVVAAIVGDRTIVMASAALALSLLGFAVVAALRPLPMTGVVAATAGGTLTALGWAFDQRHPDMVLALALLILVLFAARTAQRIPMPQAKIRGVLYVAALAGICAIPIVLAAILTLAALPSK
ncbi:MAG: hypothetical protein SFV19_13805 [Rhodospirillaceae bacterium]|nr:hypothetical protein [Rhodospirillaceae bacterium]